MTERLRTSLPETVDLTLLDSLFEHVELEEGDIGNTQTIKWKIDEHRSARIRKVTPVAITMPWETNETSREEQDNSSYFVDLARRQRALYYGICRAVWDTSRETEPKNLAQYSAGGDSFMFLGLKEITELPKVKDIFEAYDKVSQLKRGSDFSIDKSSIQPNIYTADGLKELIQTYPEGINNG